VVSCECTAEADTAAAVAKSKHSPALQSRSVNTPTKTKGIGAGKAADLSYWESAARMIASCCQGKGFKVRALTRHSPLCS
jgi:UDPglucose 6-dehydrogenase